MLYECLKVTLSKSEIYLFVNAVGIGTGRIGNRFPQRDGNGNTSKEIGLTGNCSGNGVTGCEWDGTSGAWPLTCGCINWSRDSRCAELGSVTEAGRHTALTVCNGVDQTLIDLSSLTGHVSSLTGHVDDDEPLTRPLYTSNTSGSLSIQLTTPTNDDVAYLLLYEGLFDNSAKV